jgi:hypothetical protein
MSNHRIITTLAVAAAVVATGVPASYGGQSTLAAAVHLEAHANADTTAAKQVMHRSGARARKLMARGARELARAAAIVKQADTDTSASGDATQDDAVIEAQASLSSSAADQSATLSAIARNAAGRVRAAANRARTQADAIRSDADAAIDGSGDEPDVVSVSVSAGVSSDAGDDDATADDASGGDTGTAGGVELLGILGGGAR